tara:strand:- start:1730 stop:2497 length:768 start_codon:yes stop_codon:yes gene_type:complete
MRVAAAVVVIGCLALAGCDTYPTASPDFNFTKTSLGYRNSGLLSEGRIFFWDTDTNELIDLGDHVELRTTRTVGPQKFEAKNLSGFELTGSADLTPSAKAEVSAYISRNFAFEVAGAEKEESANPLDAVLAKYAEIQPANGYFRWRVEELTSDPQRYKLVVIKDPVYATRERISVNDEAGASGSIDVPTEAIGKVKVKISRAASALCEGTRALCFVNVHVAEARLNRTVGERTLDLRTANRVSSEKLSAAFRKLI